MLVFPQAFKSLLPVEDSFFNKELRTFSRIWNISLQVKHLTQVCERGKQNQLLSTTSSLWFWRWTRLVVHFRDKFLSFWVVEHHVLKMTFHNSVKKNLFHIWTNLPTSIPVYWLARGNRDRSLSPVIMSAISSIAFFDDTSWRSSATALLVTLDLFSSLCASKSVTTCSSIFCPLTGSAEISLLDLAMAVADE